MAETEYSTNWEDMPVELKTKVINVLEHRLRCRLKRVNHEFKSIVEGINVITSLVVSIKSGEISWTVQEIRQGKLTTTIYTCRNSPSIFGCTFEKYPEPRQNCPKKSCSEVAVENLMEEIVSKNKEINHLWIKINENCVFADGDAAHFLLTFGFALKDSGFKLRVTSVAFLMSELESLNVESLLPHMQAGQLKRLHMASMTQGHVHRIFGFGKYNQFQKLENFTSNMDVEPIWQAVRFKYESRQAKRPTKRALKKLIGIIKCDGKIDEFTLYCPIGDAQSYWKEMKTEDVGENNFPIKSYRLANTDRILKVQVCPDKLIFKSVDFH